MRYLDIVQRNRIKRVSWRWPFVILEVESAMADRLLGDARSHGVARHHVEQAIERQQLLLLSTIPTEASTGFRPAQ